MKILRERTLLEEITKEWEFEYKDSKHTIREYEGLDGHRVWFNDEEIEDLDSEILDDMSSYDLIEMVKEKCYIDSLK